jgi:hypothetical protein
METPCRSSITVSVADRSNSRPAGIITDHESKMHHPLPLPIHLIVLFAAALATLARADEPATAPPASPTPDKWQYTLFNPAPDNQLRDMDTDRPNITNTPHTIDAGHWQVETGIVDYAYYRDHSSDNNVRSDDFAFGQFNLRVGVLNNLELNAVIDSYETARVRNVSSRAAFRASGFGDTIVGGKLDLWGGEGSDAAEYTALAIQPQFKFPTARNDIGNSRFEFSVAVPFLVNLPAGFHLGLQPGVTRERNSSNTGYVIGFPVSVSFDRVIFGNLDVYLEYACHVTTERHVTTSQTLDMGGTHPLTRNIVLDAGVNVGLNRASNNIEVLTGISIRR